MEKRPTESVRERVARYFLETDMDTHSFVFNSYEDAKNKADEINASYEGIAFVAKDGDNFTVKFRAQQLGEGIPEYKKEGDNFEKAA